jgi:hypothetical protein
LSSTGAATVRCVGATSAVGAGSIPVTELCRSAMLRAIS